MLNEIIYLDEPTERGSLADLPNLDCKDKGIFFFTIYFNTLEQGKNERVLKDGSLGYVKWINLQGECVDCNTNQSHGKTSINIYLNTKGSFMASQFAAVVGAYNETTKKSALVPQAQKRADGSEYYTIPDINGKRFIAGLVRTGSYEKNDGTVIPQYSLACVLSEEGFSAAHIVRRKFDDATRQRDWAAFTGQLEKQYEYQRQKDEQAQTVASYSTANVQAYGQSIPVQTYGQAVPNNPASTMQPQSTPMPVNQATISATLPGVIADRLQQQAQAMAAATQQSEADSQADEIPF